MTELKKVVLSPYFVIGVLAYVLMCFTSSAYTDPSTRKEFSIFEMITMLGTEQAQTYEFSAQFVCYRGLGTWVSMFLCIIVAFPFVKVLCDERSCTEKRYIICRMGKLRYSLSKFLSSIISAAILCALGYLLYSAAVYIIFPSIAQFSPEQAEMYDSSYLRNLLEAVIMGMGMSVLPFLVCVFTSNQYLCICVPFLLQYMMSVASSKFVLDGTWDLPEWQRTLIYAIHPTSLRNLVYGINLGYVSLAGYALLAAAAFILFTLSQRRCTDCGR